MWWSREEGLKMKVEAEKPEQITNVAVFNKSMQYLFEKYSEYQEYFDKLDYWLPEDYDEQILYDDYIGVFAATSPGNSEGVYIDCVVFYRDKEKQKNYPVRLGTLKTLKEEAEGFVTMGVISGLLTLILNKVMVYSDLPKRPETDKSVTREEGK